MLVRVPPLRMPCPQHHASDKPSASFTIPGAVAARRRRRVCGRRRAGRSDPCIARRSAASARRYSSEYCQSTGFALRMFSEHWQSLVGGLLMLLRLAHSMSSTRSATYILGPLKTRLSQEMGTSNTEFSLLIAAFSLNSTWTPLLGGFLAGRLGTTTTSIIATGLIFLGKHHRAPHLMRCWTFFIRPGHSSAGRYAGERPSDDSRNVRLRSRC